jgi:D-xylose transport system substrate-binding protein
MTVYKAYRPEGYQAAELAVSLLRGETDSDLVNRQIDNGMKDVPSVILTPVAVTRGNIADTVVRDRLWTVDQICTAAYADECRRIGLTEG